MSSETKKVTALLAEANTARKEDRFDEAKRTILTAIEIARQIPDPNPLARSLNDLARIERDLGDTDASIEIYKELADLQQKNEDRLGVAHAVRHLGDIHQDEGRIEEADECYRKALEIYRSYKKNSQVALANTLRGYALLKNHQDRKKEALSLWLEARSIYEENHIREGVKECNRWIQRLG